MVYQLLEEVLEKSCDLLLRKKIKLEAFKLKIFCFDLMCICVYIQYIDTKINRLKLECSQKPLLNILTKLLYRVKINVVIVPMESDC